mgnify:CR=1 FL=1
MNESIRKTIIEVFDKAEKYDQLIKDLAVEMRDPNGTIWDEAKRLQAENDELKHALKVIMNNPEHGGHWCADQAAWALRLYADGCADINPTPTTPK